MSKRCRKSVLLPWGSVDCCAPATGLEERCAALEGNLKMDAGRLLACQHHLHKRSIVLIDKHGELLQATEYSNKRCATDLAVDNKMQIVTACLHYSLDTTQGTQRTQPHCVYVC